MKKVAITVFVVGILLITAAIGLKIFNSTSNNDKDELKYLKFSNMKTTSETSFTFDLYNDSKQDIINMNINLYALDSNKKIIMIDKFVIENLKSHEKKTFEYSQDSIFAATPVTLYAKTYNAKDNLKNISVENNLASILKKIAADVVKKEYGNSYENINLTFTAKELQDKYNKDLGEFKNSKYKCLLSESTVMVTWDEYIKDYDYVASIDCEGLY